MTIFAQFDDLYSAPFIKRASFGMFNNNSWVLIPRWRSTELEMQRSIIELVSCLLYTAEVIELEVRNNTQYLRACTFIAVIEILSMVS